LLWSPPCIAPYQWEVWRSLYCINLPDIQDGFLTLDILFWQSRAEFWHIRQGLYRYTLSVIGCRLVSKSGLVGMSLSRSSL
jgi:hypothetical protein